MSRLLAVGAPAARRRAGAACAALGLVIVLAAAAAPRPASSAEWHVQGDGANEIEFTSEVAGFSFTGTTDAVDGYFYWDGEELFERDGQVYFEVELRALDTGIGKRDRDMREVLGVKKWPRAAYKGKVLAVEADTSGGDSLGLSHRVRTRGGLTLRGVERPMEITGLVRREGVDIVHARSRAPAWYAWRALKQAPQTMARHALTGSLYCQGWWL